MSYVALARKWRPGTFLELTGQEHVARTLENAIEGDRLHHAFLFTGTRGVGKTSSARILAKTLNCPNRKGIVPCGECASCKEISSGNSLDVIELDGASHNSVDDIRDLIDQVRYAPMNGRYRIFVIDEVHMLTRSAFNALLKTLEEPPSHVLFIFATTEVNKVPGTILSRVLRFDFKRIPPQKVIERLKFICEKEGIHADDEALEIVSEKADGSMRDALTLFDQIFAFTGVEITGSKVREILGLPSESTYAKLYLHFLEHNAAGCLELLNEVYRQGIEMTLFLQGLLKFNRNLLCYRLTQGKGDTSLSPAFIKSAPEIIRNLEPGDLMRISRVLSQISEEMRYAPSPRMALEIGLSRVCYLDRVVNLRELLEQLPSQGEALKKKA